jgi:hypothetical protein
VKTPIDTKDVSRLFKNAARKLQRSGAIDFEVREGKPSKIRFDNLRKFLRKFSNKWGLNMLNT